MLSSNIWELGNRIELRTFRRRTEANLGAHGEASRKVIWPALGRSRWGGGGAPSPTGGEEIRSIGVTRRV